MKRQILSITFAIIGALVFAGYTVEAKTRASLKMSIPFDFYVGNEKFTAGDYKVEFMGRSVFAIRSLSGKKAVLVSSRLLLGIPNERRIEKVVFNVYGSEYFLSEIWSEPAYLGRGLYRSQKERDAAKLFRELTREKRSKQVEIPMRIFFP